jgi:hypothetical protein
MDLNTFLETLAHTPDNISFNDTLSVIDANYEFTPVSFQNGDLTNAQGKNSGSCKLFAFAQLQGLTQQQTLACFGDYYRSDVLKHPDGNDHQNIRNFMKTGWDGIKYSEQPLKPNPSRPPLIRGGVLLSP